MDIQRAIFLTNVLASADSYRHLELWNQFEREVPPSERTGYYGADNVAYIKWLKKHHSDFLTEFTNETLDVKEI